MNYGKRKASKKQKRITSKKNMHKKKLGVRLLKVFYYVSLAAVSSQRSEVALSSSM